MALNHPDYKVVRSSSPIQCLIYYIFIAFANSHNQLLCWAIWLFTWIGGLTLTFTLAIFGAYCCSFRLVFFPSPNSWAHTIQQRIKDAFSVKWSHDLTCDLQV